MNKTQNDMSNPIDIEALDNMKDVGESKIEESKNNKKGRNTKLIVIVILLCLICTVGACVIGYQLYENKNINDKNIEDEKTTNSTMMDKTVEAQTEDKIAFKSIQENGEKIIETFGVTLNGKTKDINLEFTHEKDEDGIYEEIVGSFNGEVFCDDPAQIDLHEISFDTEYIKKRFNENIFRIIKGEDNKSYLILFTYSDSATSPGVDTNLLIYNDELKLISNDIDLHNSYGADETFEAMKNPFYSKNETPYDIQSSKVFIKIESDKIYKLYPLYMDDGGCPEDKNSSSSEEQDSKEYISNYGDLEERVYTIKDNKLSYKSLNKYQITAIGNCSG